MVSVKVDSKLLPDSCMIKKYKKKTRMAMMYNSKYVKKKAPMNCNIIYRDTRYSLAWAYSIQNERFYKYDLIFNSFYRCKFDNNRSVLFKSCFFRRIFEDLVDFTRASELAVVRKCQQQ